MSLHRGIDVVCLGILVADIIGRPIDCYPATGALQLVASITPHIGGCAANTGIGLEKLGCRVRVVGKVGQDGFGTLVRTELQAHQLDASTIVTSPTVPTSATMVMVSSDAERSFLHCTGANADFSADDIEPAAFQGAKLLHIAGHGLMPRFDGAPCAAVLASARAQGLKTSLDTAGAPNVQWCDNLRATLPHLDYFVPSLHEVEHLLPHPKHAPEAVANYLLEAGVGVVALKMGPYGSFVTDGHTSDFVPPFAVDAVDSTGAGDAFAAGFLAAILRGYDLKTSALIGNATGALCVTRVGTVDGYRSFSDTLDFIAQHS